jgi:hypothetical protein
VGVTAAGTKRQRDMNASVVDSGAAKRIRPAAAGFPDDALVRLLSGSR